MVLLGYLTDWTIRNIPDVFNKINFRLLDVLIHSNIDVTSATDPTLTSGWGLNFTLGNIDKCVSYGHAAGCKVLTSLYGSNVAEVSQNDSLRMQLIANLVDLMDTHNLDGIDLDIEDIAAYGWVNDTLIHELKVAAPDKLVTLAGTHFAYNPSPNLSLEAANEIDYINVMSYYVSSGSINDAALWENVINAMLHWVELGYPEEKLLMGIGAYGVDSDRTAVLYDEIVAALYPPFNQNQANLISIDTPRGTIPITGGILYWNGIDLVKEKTNWAKANGLGGIMFFDIGYDSFEPGYNLLEAIRKEINPHTGNGGVVLAGVGVLGIIALLAILTGAIMSGREK